MIGRTGVTTRVRITTTANGSPRTTVGVTIKASRLTITGIAKITTAIAIERTEYISLTAVRPLTPSLVRKPTILAPA